MALALLTVGILFGIAIWVVSPWLTGTVEPWDADTPIWSLSWLVVAIAGGLIGHVRGACLPLGYALGQMLVTIRSVFNSEFGVLGWAFIGGYAAVAALIALAVTGVVMLFKYYWRTRRASAIDA
jgi:hypothetical protein